MRFLTLSVITALALSFTVAAAWASGEYDQERLATKNANILTASGFGAAGAVVSGASILAATSETSKALTRKAEIESMYRVRGNDLRELVRLSNKLRATPKVKLNLIKVLRPELVRTVGVATLIAGAIIGAITAIDYQTEVSVIQQRTTLDKRLEGGPLSGVLSRVMRAQSGI